MKATKGKHKATASVALGAALLLTGFGCGSRTPPGRAAESAAGIEHATNASSALRVRPPAVAGAFYPADKQLLAQTIDAALERAPEPYIPRLRGLICPHAGYRYSGQTAACAYKLLAGRPVHTVIILGPSHYALFQGVSVPNVDAYETPLGLVRISELARGLTNRSPFVREAPCRVERPPWWMQSSRTAPGVGEDTPETWEHSVEVQIPFLQKTLKDFKILPVVFGDADPAQVAKVLADVIDENTVVVASSDLSHFHPDAEARELDGRCIKAICDLNADEMKAQEACGKGPIMALINLARQKGWKARLLGSSNSSDASGDKDRVVGYAAIGLYEPGPDKFDAAERKFLLDLARTTLLCVATNPAAAPPEPAVADVSPKLTAPTACFVTLTRKGSLRGCIGHIVAQEPLYRAVVHNAENAAIHDPRFLPVQSEEVGEIKIEISVLTEPQALRFSSPEDLLAKLQPYNDGVLLRIGGHGATFLPQVWAQIPDKIEFLNQLSRKAGCAPAAWRGNETSVAVYHVEAFAESD